MSGYPQLHDGRYGIGLSTGQFYPHSFGLGDLTRFEEFVGEHERCIWYSEVAEDVGIVDTNAIAIRHDVDHSIIHAHRFASWEAERGIKSSYYILPTAPYYKRENALSQALEIQAMGHAIGVHNDAHCEVARRLDVAKFAPEEIARRALILLREWAEEMRAAGLSISGCADHGGGEPSNVALWRTFGYVPEDAGLLYECYRLHGGAEVVYRSDNRGQWNGDLVRVEGKQTHCLIHPCHWRLS